MVEFNPDGSIKLPSKLVKAKVDMETRMQTTKCIKIEKEVLSDNSPKKCVLHITLSKAFPNGTIVENVYSFFQKDAETPSKLIRRNDYEWDIEIGTSYKRCTECFDIINRFKAYLEDNVLVDKGTCNFESKFFY